MIEFKELRKYVQEDVYFCWAASIQIVSDYYLGLSFPMQMPTQESFKNNLTDPNELIDDGTEYKRIFNKVELGMFCTEKKSNEFPSINYLRSQFSKNQIFIFSSLKTPIIGQNHAIVVSGFYQKMNNEVFWLLSLDPRDTTFTYKTAWVYNELITKNSNDHNLFFISNFRKSSNPPLEIACFENNSSSLGFDNWKANKVIINSLNFILQNSDLFVFFECDLLGLTSDAFFHYYEYRSVILNNALVIPGLWQNQQSKGIIVYLPVWKEGLIVVELFFEVVVDDSNNICLRLMGVQETSDVVRNSFLYNEEGSEVFQLMQSGFDLNQEEYGVAKLNFNIINFEPLNLLFYEVKIQNKYYLSPLNDLYPPVNSNSNIFLKKLTIYKKEKIQKYFKQFLIN